MATYKASGIIIARRNFFEADRIITVLTKFRGKLNILAKGVRKHLSKNAGAIEMFVVCDLMFAEGRNFDILASAQIIKSFKKIRDSLSKTAIAYKISELTDLILKDEQEHADVYNLINRVFEYLNKTKLKTNNIIFEYFAINAISMAGFEPQLSSCVECGGRLLEKGNYFSPIKGGILCLKCSYSDKIIIEVNSNQIKLLRIFLKKDIAYLKKIKISSKDVQNVKKTIDLYVKNIVEKELKSGKFEEKITKMGQGA